MAKFSDRISILLLEELGELSVLVFLLPDPQRVDFFDPYYL
mgnify:CR=1 FL=1|jgi:hypothetical protein